MIRRIPVAQSADLSQTRGTEKTSIDSYAWDVPGGAPALGITGSKCPVHSTSQVENIRYHQLLPGPSFPTSLSSPPKPVLLKPSLLGKNGPQSTPSNHRWSTTPLSIASKKVLSVPKPPCTQGTISVLAHSNTPACPRMMPSVWDKESEEKPSS